MRPSLRFLALAVVGWTGVRAASLGVLPGAELFRIDQSEAKVAPIAATQFAPIEPLAEAPDYQAIEAAMFQGAGRTMAPIVYYQLAAPPPQAYAPAALDGVLPEPRPHFYAPIPQLDQWPLSRIAASSLPPLQSWAGGGPQSVPAVTQRQGPDRLQLSSWAMLRSQRSGVAGTPSLSSGGSLGASQVGARLMYNFTPQLAAVLRSSSEVGRRGGEIAAGVRLQPLRSIPVWITAERRQRIGKYGGGTNDFALFFESGLYGRAMPLDFLLDAYLQGGVVGLRRRDKFIDGGLTLTRPVYRQFSAGLGVWGGAQPGVYRVDAGPRVTMRVRNNVRVHVDWRQRVAGNALPGSGPAITLAGDF